MLNENQEQLVNKLTNFLKLPKAQRWMCCEWFYSDIDKYVYKLNLFIILLYILLITSLCSLELFLNQTMI